MRTDFLIERMKDEKEYGISGGIYNMTQIDMAYNSNHMEGNTLSHEQTRYIYDTHSLNAENISVDDVIETANHFRCFDMILEHCREPLTESFIKSLHHQLKTGTFSSQSKEAVIGDYKKFTNYVSDIKTSSPKDVHKNIVKLLDGYNSKDNKTLDDIIDFHASFEAIHPFYDGNGRIGRLIMFKECLANNIVPFIIREDMKLYYIKGLNEWQHGNEKGFLRDFCFSMQDEMFAKLQYFDIPYIDKEEKEGVYISSETDSYIRNFIKKSEEKPSFFMLCGIPGSGKHEKAEKLLSLLPENTKYIRSKDYWDKYGDLGADIVFSKIRNNIKDSLSKGENVIYSATNLTKEIRINVLKECVIPYKAKTELYVCYQEPGLAVSDEPYEKLCKMAFLLHENNPNVDEGWNHIGISETEPKLYLDDIRNDRVEIDDIEQDKTDR